MFGLSFGELCVLVIVAIVVIGPKDMPRVLKKMGQFAGKIRRMASDVRSQSGIDEVLRTEGLTKEITEIRRLAQGDFSDPVPAARREERPAAPAKVSDGVPIVREREYPREGADGYGALPDTSIVYAGSFPDSEWAKDPLYMLGDADAKMPEPPAEEALADAPDAPVAAKAEADAAASDTSSKAASGEVNVS